MKAAAGHDPRSPATSQQMATRASAADVDPGYLPRACDPAAATRLLPSKPIEFPVVLGTLALPVTTHAWAAARARVEGQQRQQQEEYGVPPTSPEACQISWAEGDGLAGDSRGRPRKLVLHRPQPPEESGSNPTSSSDQTSQQYPAGATKKRQHVHSAARSPAAPDLEEDLELDETTEEEAETEARAAPSSPSEPKGSKDRRYCSSLKYGKDDEEYVPRKQGWDESSDEEPFDPPAAARPAARRPPMTSDGRPLVTRRRKTAADWAAEMDQAVANRGAWRGGRIAFAGGDSDSEDSGDNWGGEAASSTCSEEEEQEEEEEDEEKADPRYTCAVEASDHDHALHCTLRYLYALCEIGWIELSATLRFSTEIETIQRPAFQPGPRGLRGVAAHRVQAIYLEHGLLPKPEEEVVERTIAAVSLNVVLLEPAVSEPSSQGRNAAKYRTHQKYLRVIIDALLHHVLPAGAASLEEQRLRLGPASDPGLNVGHVSTTDWDEAVAARHPDSRLNRGGSEDSMRPFTVAGLLESIEADDSLSLASIPVGLHTQPLQYQRQAVSWMLQREAMAAAICSSAPLCAETGRATGAAGTAAAAAAAATAATRLNPTWDQVVAADGQVLYAHRMTGQIDTAFHAAQRGSTCGGCLCDEVGLGKTLEVLYLTLAHPAGSWAVDAMPAHQEGIEKKSGGGGQPDDKLVEWSPVPVRATLVVAPATLLDQWQAEIARHSPTLLCAVYTGCGAASTSAVQASYTQSSGAGVELVMDASNIDVELSGRRKRRRVSADNEKHPPVNTTDEPAGDREVRRPILAACQPGLFVMSQGSTGAGDRAPDGSADCTIEGGDGFAPVDIASCDIILASYETFRKELGSARSSFSVSPLEQLGFWRIVLDEAQLVSKTNSVAAQMAAHLWRRHAWVVTGTPVASSVQEIHGLLDFLGHDFGNKELWRSMLQDPFVKERSPAGLCRMRALLRDVVLRRTKRQAHILEQMNLPPLAWHPITMPLATLERKAYDKAAAALSRSYSRFKPVLEGQMHLRKRAIAGGGGAATGGAARGFDGKNAAAKKYARFIGDVTRLRQTACHPQIVRRSDSLFGGKRLTMQEIMAKLIERERSSACAAAVSCLRAQIVEAVVANAPPTPIKGSRSDATYLALWNVPTWMKLAAMLDDISAQGAAMQEEQRAQRQRDNDPEPFASPHEAGGEQANEAPAAAATTASESSGGDEDGTDVTKAWAKLRTEVTALRKFIAMQISEGEASGGPDGTADGAAAASQDGDAQASCNTGEHALPAPITAAGSRDRATSAASRRARARTAPPKLFATALSLIRRTDGGKAASSAVVSREQRRATALEHSLVSTPRNLSLVLATCHIYNRLKPFCKETLSCSEFML
eukprot:COSAG03_NODE_482_length_7563_cov_113.365086_4_plen_1377_part_00